jgi:ABC-type multidrug transport system fused ATPase/permease subunit
LKLIKLFSPACICNSVLVSIFDVASSRINISASAKIDEEVITAAKAASAHSFIKHLPNQYETEIASEGSKSLT